MDKDGLKDWRQRKGLTRKRLAGLLGVTPMAVAYWEWGIRRLPALLPLALEALENRFEKEGMEQRHDHMVPGAQEPL